VGTKRQINGKLIINDLRSGLRDEDLQIKYKLSSYALLTIYRRLLAHNAISHFELCERSPLYTERIKPAHQRKCHRLNLHIPIGICDVQTSANGVLSNISEKGLRIAGIQATIGDVKTFEIPLDVLMQTNSLVIKAKCKWIELMGQNQKYLAAGFEITDLSERDGKTLQDFMRFLVLNEPGPSGMV
jgi:PilZ domain